MRYPWLDWVFMGTVVLAIVFFFSFIQQRNAVGNVVGGIISTPSENCVNYSASQPYALSSSLLLCPATTHRVDYFALSESDLVIDCQGSTIQGTGGALFVAQTNQPTVTLRDCVIEGYDGLYSAQNPVTVKIESRE